MKVFELKKLFILLGGVVASPVNEPVCSMERSVHNDQWISCKIRAFIRIQRLTNIA